MNKSELVSTIAAKAELSLTKAEKALGATLESIIEALTNGGEVSLVGFGRFGVRKRNERKVRNPQTGKEMIVKAATVPYFKAGKNLKDTVDTGK